jgi:hypothetical protein
MNYIKSHFFDLILSLILVLIVYIISETTTAIKPIVVYLYILTTLNASYHLIAVLYYTVKHLKK